LRPGHRYWSPLPNPARFLNFLVGRILKFHESEPLLNPEIIRHKENRRWKQHC
jgi:hypothetical protein